MENRHKQVEWLGKGCVWGLFTYQLQLTYNERKKGDWPQEKVL